MRKIFLAAAILTCLAACKSAQVRPTAKHDFPQSDIKNCYDRARNIDTTLGEMEDHPIKLTLFMLVDKDGAVPAAFLHDAQNNAGTILSGCLVDAALESKFDSEHTDFVRPQPMLFGQRGLAQFKQLKDQPPGELDPKLSQGTLTFAGWATPADKGWGYYLVHDYAKAIEQFHAAVAAKSDDARAQRGLALALVASGGDVKAARAAAEAAVKAEPDSVAAHEAMVHVCLAQKDDKCVLDSWERATIGEMDNAGKVTKPVDPMQKQARSFELAQIQEQVKAVHERFSATEKDRKPDEAAQAKASSAADPTGCGKFPEGDERTLCFVKYCFADGAKAHLKDLKEGTGADYSVGSWKVTKGKGGASNVSVQFRPKGGGEPHAATWSVKVGENVNMDPLTFDAKVISAKHNACNK